jgi:hypothetical protein
VAEFWEAVLENPGERKKSETIRKITVEREKSGCCRLLSGMLYQYFLL